MTETPTPAPGWYADPEMAGTQRYWDGANWTDHRAPGAPAPPKRKDGIAGWRASTWLIVIWSVLMGVWIISGLASADDCPPNSQTACDVGTGIAVSIILGIWFFGFVILSLIWLMTRPRG